VDASVVPPTSETVAPTIGAPVAASFTQTTVRSRRTALHAAAFVICRNAYAGGLPASLTAYHPAGSGSGKRTVPR
jgi:hypothetical protein